MLFLNRLVLISFAGALTIPALAASATNARPDTAAALPSRAAVPLPATFTATTAASGDDVGTLAKVEPVALSAVATGLDPASIDCVAKIVRHEAANQSPRGQLAVAQLVVARTQAGDRFGRTPCAVANQPGQFFDTTSYDPDRSSAQWTRAVSASRDALGKVSDAVVPGALFYHATSQAPSRFFRGRQRVAVVGDHAFYR